MKKYFILIIIASMSVGLYAQDYNDYLMEARNYLQSGQVEKAKSSYNMYKKMTGKADYEFESKIKSQENNNDRKVTVRSSASATTTVKVVRHADGSISTYPVDNSTSSNSTSHTKKQIKIGDYINGYRVCYINNERGWGFLISMGLLGTWHHASNNKPSGWRFPGVKVSQLIYSNRHLLGLNQEYWTADKEGRYANTIDFSTGEIHKAKLDDHKFMYYVKVFYLDEI